MTPTLTPSAAPSTASQHDALLEPPGEPSGGPCESNVGSGRSWTTRGAAAGIGVVVFVGTVLVAVLGVTAGCSGRGCCGGVPTLECLRRSLGHAACQGWCAPGADPQPAPRVFLRPPAALPKAALAGGAPPSPLRSLALAPTNAGCFLVDAGKMLLVKHTSGFLDIPGGTGKVGEPPEATAARETFEETGHQVVATGLKDGPAPRFPHLRLPPALAAYAAGRTRPRRGERGDLGCRAAAGAVAFSRRVRAVPGVVPAMTCDPKPKHQLKCRFTFILVIRMSDTSERRLPSKGLNSAWAGFGSSAWAKPCATFTVPFADAVVR
eukprot:CAMPEP_0179283878 /NCGR_PEP_ID=MMETSP0797-20121207/38402_1 /TAXON_ID=47934 /ORGANISM="Dinophysis acuminata, Strain DAEP01" /LENGTH=321 /DNA_ID=CAMNT_0020992643 /DNA_START=53 /DNA_END=1013 /DNA_ORIENTATION=+